MSRLTNYFAGQNIWSHGSVGRAHRSHRWGHRFESCCDHHQTLESQGSRVFFCPSSVERMWTPIHFAEQMRQKARRAHVQRTHAGAHLRHALSGVLHADGTPAPTDPNACKGPQLSLQPAHGPVQRDGERPRRTRKQAALMLLFAWAPPVSFFQRIRHQTVTLSAACAKGPGIVDAPRWLPR